MPVDRERLEKAMKTRERLEKQEHKHGQYTKGSIKTVKLSDGTIFRIHPTGMRERINKKTGTTNTW